MRATFDHLALSQARLFCACLMQVAKRHPMSLMEPEEDDLCMLVHHGTGELGWCVSDVSDFVDVGTRVYPSRFFASRAVRLGLGDTSAL